ncbi:NAD(P)-dependent oxidoreductase [Mycolicibacter sinensis]|jgi:3-hydroxyisobutyrate dehydrogenase-like beta-hydroxyacid dehydrogenase|uniref:6-phosphogluconate dehydrogenase n=1 Tax=Mycolicibacter sinensis (strain JDM601) TaxID=875328 RepID=A0A1A2NY46_MYCSD|nr:NAD(P)-dependent oxidoreductase [Mycolicibacter sinensis]OBH20001.1 6-phosphogluconate dehydrogenase [Mycolicibacter sinensis]OBI31646.1 6-phosphogluconate dehydrogenase [Mycolicibacter sinensis]
MAETIGFVGAGKMGEPMVLRLVGAGFSVQVYARRPEVRERLAAAGAVPVESVAAVARDAGVVISCLFSDAQLLEVAAGADGLLANAGPDTVVVSHTTGTVSTLIKLMAEFPDGPVLVDAPVSGGAHDIAAGKLTVLLGGPDDAVARAQPVLAAYADPVITTGGLGTALNLKLINNVLFAANAQLVAAAVELAKNLEVPETSLFSALEHCSGGSRAAGYVQSAGGVESFAQVVAPFMRKDVAACIEAAADRGVELGQLRTVAETGPLDLS